jgi:hypothetical protein
MDKILIFEDTGAKNQFIANCETTKDQANDLITLFESFQDLSSVTTAEMFERLVSDPVGYFDAVLRSNVDMKMTGGREPEPATLATLFGYNRIDYVKSIQGMPITSGCKSCKGETIVRKTRPALTDARWTAYKSFLTFTPSGFVLNDEAITEYCQKFNYYATEPKQLEVVELFNQLIDALNKFDEMTPLRQTDKENLTRMFKIGIERPPFDGKFLIEPRMLMELVFKY